MELDLVHRAVEDSRSREPVVQAVVCMRAARVLGDPALFREGAALLRSVEEGADYHFAWAMADDAVRIGCQVDADAAEELFRRTRWDNQHALGRRGSATAVVQALVRTGEIERAMRLVEDYRLEANCAGIVAQAAEDDGIKRRALEAALSGERHGPGLQDYYRLLSLHWRVLENPAAVIRGALVEIESNRDQPMQAEFDGVRFEKMRDFHLFMLLGAMRGALPEHEVEAALARFPAVSKAAQTFPRGYEDYLAAAQARAAKRGGGGFGYVCAGSDSAHMELMMSAHRGDRSAVPKMLEAARHKFIEDVDPARPNLAPKVYWPSCGLYASAAYHAGRMAGMGGAEVLEHIPDSDFALLAQIEFAAGVRGLPEHGFMQMTRGR